MDLWSIRITVEDEFKELFSEYFEDFDVNGNRNKKHKLFKG